jgi:hypothetical protein
MSLFMFNNDKKQRSYSSSIVLSISKCRHLSNTHHINERCSRSHLMILFRYMGIGLSTSDVNLNRLPGWDKGSYGYHGDDGHSFCSSGSGIVYGPTFTTDDFVGCCVNFLDNSCFYTRNGYNLGKTK